MSVDHLTKRTIYIATCPKCGQKDIRTENPPRERHCPACGVWYPFIAESYIGPDLFDGGAK